MKRYFKQHSIHILIAASLLGTSALGSVWLVVKKNQVKEKEIEIVKLDSIAASKLQQKEVESLFENLLVSEERTRILDTLLSHKSLDVADKKHILDELKDHNVVLTALRCDITQEDSLAIGNFQSEEIDNQTVKIESAFPQSLIASNFKGGWAKNGRIKSKKQIEVSFDYREPHWNDTLPIFVLLKSENGDLVDCIKKCPTAKQNHSELAGIKVIQKIKFRASIEKSGVEENISDLLVFHSREGFIGHVKLR